jgi:hypothetical protein
MHGLCPAGQSRCTQGETRLSPAFPSCEPRCDLSTWPDKNLILGACPLCTRWAEPEQTWRMLKAHRLVEERAFKEAYKGMIAEMGR